jgi:hypothetical protein
VICLTEGAGRLRQSREMAEKTYQSSFDPQGVVADYALIATGVAAALIGLIYLILI